MEASTGGLQAHRFAVRAERVADQIDALAEHCRLTGVPPNAEEIEALVDELRAVIRHRSAADINNARTGALCPIRG